MVFRTEREIILGIVPVAQFIQEGNFDKAIGLKLDKYKAFHASIMIDKALALSCNKLIKEGKFDEVIKLIVLMEKNRSGTTRKENVIKDLAIEFVKLDQFDKAVECARMFDVKNPDTGPRMAEIIIALCEKSKLEEALKIEKISIDERSFYRDEVISIYSDVFANNFDAAILKGNRIFDQEFQSTMLSYISRKLLEAGQVDKAIEVAFMIKDPVIKTKTIKMFS